TGQKIHGYYRDRRAKQFYSVDYSPDGHYVALGGEGRKFILSEATSGKVVNAFHGDWDADTETQLFYTHIVRFSPNGHCFVTGSNDDEIILRETATGKVFTRFSEDAHSHAITSIRFSPDGRYLVSGSADRMVIIWNLESILDPKLFAEYFSYPLVLTGVKFPKRTLAYLKKTNQGNIAPNRPLARCGECGNFFPVSGKMLGKQISCPVKTNDHNCGRLLRINTFTAG
ncbi:MAG: hypothetical protein GY866_27850, partial [Proteobacteria bacterium]|nr:hypothetical protein [Pseudomonadota bacterium]